MFSSRKIKILSMLLLIPVRLTALAAAPVNDSYSTPTTVSGFPSTATGSNVDATLQTDESMPDDWGDSAEASVWFRWISHTSGTVRIDTFGSDFDTMLAVWTGTAVNALTLLAENDEYNGSQSAVFITVSPDVTYRIGVYGWLDARGAIALHVTNDTSSKITGTVTNGATPLVGIQATVYRRNVDLTYWETINSADTDASGHYILAGLDPGAYRVRFRDRDGHYITEYYDDSADLDSATDIEVAAGTIVSNVNASLATASKIAGTVTGPNGTLPLEGITVSARYWDGSRWTLISHDHTDVSGVYAIGGLTAGTYRVEFEDDNGNYLPEVYSNAPALDAGINIVVPASATVSNVNAALASASKIAGTVTGPNGSTPLAGIWATAYRWNDEDSYWEHVFSDSTDSSGIYGIGGLTVGTYRVEFWDSSGNYLSEVYSNAPTLDAGRDIVVSASATVSNVNAALATASKIAGTVTGTNGTPPLAGIQATAYQWDNEHSFWESVNSDSTDSSGTYAIGRLTAGTYRVEFRDYSGNYLPEVYSNAPALDAGRDIAVPASTTVSNVNASLATASKIAGTVTGPNGTPPLGGIRATAYRWNAEDSDWESVNSGSTGSSGAYAIGGLTAGTYRVEFRDYSGNYLPEVYSNAPTLDAGRDIVVPAHTTVSNVNAALASASKIAGKVTGTNGTPPLGGIRATAYRWDDENSFWESESTASTDASGNYTIRGLTAGTYRVWFYDPNGNYLPEVYSNAATLDGGWDIVVAAYTTVSNVNASLASASKIAGTVTGPNGTPPLAGIQATAYQWDGDFSYWEETSSAHSDASGNYTIRGLTAGTYRVEFDDNSGNYLPEVYSNAPTLDAGRDIVVAAYTTVSNVNASLAIASKISGTVTGPDGTTPLDSVWVHAYRWDGADWANMKQTATGASGRYTLGGLAAGTYRVRFVDGSGDYASEAYSNAVDIASGRDIVVPAGTTVSNINASLSNWSGISGAVTGPDGTTPLDSVGVFVYRWDGADWDYMNETATGGNGRYTLGGLSAGTYRVRFEDWSGTYSSEAYSNAVSIASGTDIVVPAGTTVSNINASLSNWSGISGTVTGPDGTTLLEGILVSVYHRNGAAWAYMIETTTDGGGHYSIGQLAAGTYRVRFEDWSGTYSPEAYSNAVDIASGTDIVVPAGTTVSNINASLASIYATISGTVTGPGGTTALDGIWVYVHRWNGSNWEYMNETTTGAGGHYSLGGLWAGTYRVRFVDGSGNYASAAYSNAADIASGTDIVVPTGATITGIDAALPNWSGISGTVTGPDGTTLLGGILISVYHRNGADWDYMNETTTDASGYYVMGGLVAGTYNVQFSDWNGYYVTEAYSNALNLASGTDIAVPVGTTVSNINASLAANYSMISGTVTGSAGGAPLQGVWVSVYQWNNAVWNQMDTVATGSGGRYSIGWLAAGTYRVAFECNSGNYLYEAYNGATNLDSATDIVVPAGMIVSGINAVLTTSGDFPSEVVGIQKTGANALDLSIDGTDGRSYMMQWTPSMTGAWVNTGGAFSCGPGNYVIPLDPTGTSGFWRVILAP